jgi:Holliday junction DNA helicase RuvA
LAGADVANPVEEAVSALAALGYKPQDASRMVRAVDSENLSTEDIIRSALQATVQ